MPSVNEILTLNDVVNADFIITQEFMGEGHLFVVPLMVPQMVQKRWIWFACLHILQDRYA